MKSLLRFSLCLLLLGAMTKPLCADPVFGTWVGGTASAERDFTVAANWDPDRDGVSTTDTLRIDVGGDSSPILNTTGGTISGLFLGSKYTSEIGFAPETATGGSLTIQNGGSLLVNGMIDIGVVGPVTGENILNMTGGTLSQSGPEFRIGLLNNAGTFNMSGNSQYQGASTITVGALAGGTGTLNMSGSSIMTHSGAINVGALAGDATGTLSMAGSSRIANTGDIVIGTTGTGTLIMTGGTTTGNSPSITTNTAARFGVGSAGTGSITNASFAASDFVVGQGAGGIGTLTLTTTSGSANPAKIEATAGAVHIGFGGGSGVLNIGEGSIVSSKYHIVVGFLGSATGTVSMTGGSVTTSGAGGFVMLGYQGTGEWNQSGGTVTDNTAVTLGGLGGFGTLNLNGGVFSTGQIGNADGVTNGTVNFDGGTLKVNPNSVNLSTNFFNPDASATAHIYVRSLGATIDTSGKNIAINSPLEEDLSSLGGGLAKIGGGALSLGGANTYTGPTSIQEGRLNINGSLPGVATVFSGATLGGAGSIGGLVTVKSGGIVSPGTSIGTLNIGTGGLNFENNSSLVLEINGSTGAHDDIVVNGDVASDSPVTVHLNCTLTGSTFSAVKVLEVTGGYSLDSAGNISFDLPGIGSTLDSYDGIHENPTKNVVKGVNGYVEITPGAAIADPQWNVTGTNNYGVATNWNPSANPPSPPMLGSQRAMFTKSTLSGPITVNVNVSPTLSSMVFNSGTGTAAYTLQPAGGSIIMDSSMTDDWHITALSGTHAINANIAMSEGTGQSVVRVAGGAQLTLGGVLSDLTATPSSLNVDAAFGDAGDGILVLAGANTYSGKTTLSRGVLKVSVLVNGGAPSQLGRSDASPANLVLNGGTLQYTGPAGGSTNRGFTVGGTAAVQLDNDATFSGQIVGNPGSMLNVVGPGTMTLSRSGTSAFDAMTIGTSSPGTMSVAAGTLSLNTAYVGEGGVGVLNVSGGTATAGDCPSIVQTGVARIGRSGGTGTVAISNANYTTSEGGTAAGDIVLGADAGSTGTMTLTTTSGSANPAQLTVSSAMHVGFNGGIGQWNINGDSKAAVHNHIVVGFLGGASGTVSMNEGTIAKDGVGGTYVMLGYDGNGVWNQNGGTVTDNTMVTLGGTSGVGTLNLNGGVFSTGQIGNADGVTNGTVNFNGGTLKANPSSIYLNGNFFDPGTSSTAYMYMQSLGGTIDTSGVDIAINPAISEDVTSPGGGLTKIGQGVLTLGGYNTYAGLTSVKEGGLVLSGSGYLQGNVEVSGGASLGGGGLFNGNVDIKTGAVVTPGPGATMYFMGNLSLQTGTTLTFDYDGTYCSSIYLLSAKPTVNGTSTVDFRSGVASPSGTFPVIQWTAYDTLTPGSLVPAQDSIGRSSIRLDLSTPTAVNAIFAPITNEWSGAVSGDYSTTEPAAQNWINSGGAAYEPGTGQQALFGTTAAGNYAVNVNAAGLSLGSIIIDNPSNAYSLSGNAVTLASSAVKAQITVLGSPTEGHAIANDLTLNNDTEIHVSGSTTALTLSGAIDGTKGLTLFGETFFSKMAIGGTAGNTYAGTTVLQSGQVILGKPGGPGGYALPGDVVVSSAANSSAVLLMGDEQIAPTASLALVPTGSNWSVFSLNGHSQTVAKLTGGSQGEINNTHEFVGGDTATANGTLTVNNSVDCTYSGFIHDTSHPEVCPYALALVKDGPGKLTLSPTGNAFIGYTGGTTVKNGILDITAVPDSQFQHRYLDGARGAISIQGGELRMGNVNSQIATAVQLTGGSITGSVSLTSQADFDIRAGSASVALAGDVGLVKTTAGTVTLTGANSFTGQSIVAGGTLKLGPAAQATVLSGGGADIQSGKMIFDAVGNTGLAETIRLALTASYHNGVWDAGQFHSSTSQQGLRTLGWSDGLPLGSTADPTQITVMYTLVGDTDLDGSVGISDLNAVLSNYGQTKVWKYGDVDYDHVVGTSDLNAVLTNYGRALPGDVYVGGLNLDAGAIGELNAFGVNAVVPEPGTLVLLLVAALGLAIRIYRKRK